MTVPSESYCFNAPREKTSTENSWCLPAPPPLPGCLILYEHRWLGSHSSGIAQENPQKISISQKSGKEPNHSVPYLPRDCPRVSFCRGFCEISSSDFGLAKSRVGSKSVPYTFILECEGSCGLRNRTWQVTFSFWSTLESSLAAGSWSFKNMVMGSHVQYHFIWEISPPGMQCLTFPPVSVNNKR